MFWGNWFSNRGAGSVSASTSGGGGVKPAVPTVRARRGRAGNRGSSKGGLRTGSRAGLPLPHFPFRPVVVVAAAGMPFKIFSTSVAKFAQQFTGGVNSLLGDRVHGWANGVAQQWNRDADALKEVCRVFAVRSVNDLQDVLNSLILSECVYKAVDSGAEGGAAVIAQLKGNFPLGLVSIHSVQWALPHVNHRYMLAESDSAVYVAFMGTKQRRDLFTNANVLQEVLWDDLQEVPGGEVHRGAPAAHRGFLRRARAVPIESLYLHAHRKGKRLVLCGHSLGGAVATLCTVRLLQHLPPPQQHFVKCYGFATPPVGNAALSRLVQQAGWDQHINNFMLPEDVIPRLLTFARRIDHHATVAYRPEGAPALEDALPSRPAQVALPVASMAVGAPTTTDRALTGAAAGGSGRGMALPARGRKPAAALWRQNSGNEAQHAVAAAALQAQQQGEQQHQAGAWSPSRLQLPFWRAAEPAAISSGGSAVQVAAALNSSAAGASSSSGQDHQQQAQQANNILAPSASQMERLKRLASGMGRRKPGAQLASVTASVVGSDASPSVTALDSDAGTAAAQRSTGVASTSGKGVEGNVETKQKRRWHAKVARTASIGVSKAAQLVSTPMRATRAYVAVGRQLYVLPHNVSREMPVPSPETISAVQQVEAAAQEAEAAATAAASATHAGQVPDAAQQRKRVLFHMHRMASYRARVTAILMDSLGAQVPGGKLLELPGRRHAGVLLTHDIAPRLRPFSAAGYLAATPVPEAVPSSSPPSGGAPATAVTTTTASPNRRLLMLLTGGVAAAATPGGKWTWPWAALFAQVAAQGKVPGMGAQGRAPKVDVLLRITGQGLENCSRVDLAASTGSAAVVTADIVAKPVAPLPLQLHRGHLQQLAGPLQEAWHVVKAYLGQDPLLVKVSIPQPLLEKWAERENAAAQEGKAGGTLGAGAHRLSVRLVGDFQVLELPLKLDAPITEGPECVHAEQCMRQATRFFANAKL